MTEYTIRWEPESDGQTHCRISSGNNSIQHEVMRVRSQLFEKDSGFSARLKEAVNLHFRKAFSDAGFEILNEGWVDEGRRDLD